MSDAAGVKAASYAAPVAQATPATGGDPGNGTIRRPTGAAAADALDTNTLNDGRVVVPLAGKYVDIKNEDLVNSLEVAFASSAVTLVYGQQSTFAAGSAVAGWRINPGETISVICPTFATHFCHVLSAAGPSTVAVRCSERNVKG